MSANEVVLDVVLLEGAEETPAAKAAILELLAEGQRAQPGLGEGLAHRPAARLPVARGRPRRDPLREGRACGGMRALRARGAHVELGSAAAADVLELLDALVDERRRRLLVGHRHAAAEEHLELLGKRVVELGRAAQLLLAGDLPGLADGADDLGHLRGKGARYRRPQGTAPPHGPARHPQHGGRAASALLPAPLHAPGRSRSPRGSRDRGEAGTADAFPRQGNAPLSRPKRSNRIHHAP